MRLWCRLCGTRTDGRERLGSYCPGERCGTDLRAGEDAGVQAWCEPQRLRGEPGRTVAVRLVVRNAGLRADTFRVEPVEQVDGRLDFDAAVLNVPLAPGHTRGVEVTYTPPRDRTAWGIDIASRFGVPGADAAGRIDDARGSRFGVALRVVSEHADQGAACAAFAVDAPGRFRDERHHDNSGAARARSTPMLVGGAVLALIVVIAVVVAVAANKDDGGTSGPSATGEVTASVSAAVSTGPGATTDADGSDGGGTTSGGADAGADGGSKGGNSGANAGSNAGAGGGDGGDGETTTPPAKAKVRVPDVTTLPDTNAASQLEAAGFTVKREYLEGTGGPRGLVQSQQPAASTLADKGSTVVLRLRDGKVKVPDVVGMSARAAEAELEGIGFVVEFPETFAAGDPAKVVSTDPAAGELAAEGSTVLVSTD
ncbi:PASTA domain-containing protein [Yinghuangia sp. ASG 101]|uniref:PASTA domain-containing protein n=1 Tax=Yinghuangia sp. ASG 101 TaxID=2896848 RepID=UPI001E58B04B|nr:PASTA domain-containing protein [Yinghuangia sp. ASG 101]UGQ11759.1 PASTA domain-containing protein [Yinghuangia sp. ASG 101]